ncbi:prolipoprotein diacylglyceryl transferase [Candidatus Chlamydia sanziniae]|uniref:Phosphatidylglycerol--prolipoprotein diacylglyceryl transferase n=1 Tax=Candidatus Chlamydia sanziniae TaxID=1806891 RepID=A0A1A9HYD4_9CHLA|nr:prolipoprotein diacylglyceryl transferase [Candidatus Chlamydia sanziniae]ANH79054.1 Prolipoprotein diacylglyceryl transferase [Candidatus Chlamydia sanziniae]
MQAIVAAINWTYSKVLWTSKSFPLQLTWYGVFFTLGILLASILSIYLGLSYYNATYRIQFSKSDLKIAIENFALYSILFILPMARLAYVVFYGWSFYLEHPQEIIKVWHGGLASHGGIFGLILEAIIFTRKYRKKIPLLTFLFLMDLCGAVFGITAFLIRIGNLFNQEIIGKPTRLPWGIIFSNSVQGKSGVPVHPVQLYEGIGYLLLSGLLYFLTYKRYLKLGKGYVTAFACIGIALIRFCAEYVKTHQGTVVSENSLLTIGQILSFPLFVFGVVLGVVCFLRNRKGTSLI